MTGIYWAGGLSIAVLAILILLAPLWLRAKRYSPQTEATHNIRQLHLALLDFDSDYGRFPDVTTIATVRSDTHTTLTLGTSSSNDYFRQLIAAGTANNETIFWAKTPATPRKPNNILGADALKKGECSFAYVAGHSASNDSSTPVAMTPMIAGTYQFDPAAFGDKAVVLRIDGSAKPEVINSTTREVVIPGGKTLFDSSQSYWHGKAPDLKWPE
jgi:type II secretory pathway pseudopilin PulG